jgi:hypothetical protein
MIMAVPQELVLDLMEERMLLHREAEGFIIAGFPRDVLQASAFQSRSHHSSGIFVFLLICPEKGYNFYLGSSAALVRYCLTAASLSWEEASWKGRTLIRQPPQGKGNHCGRNNPWLARWARRAVTRDFLSCLGCSGQPGKKYFFLTVPTRFQFMCPHRPATWADSRAGSACL